MQWPPRPGPGQKGMNPNGLVDAASMVSQMSMPIRSPRMAISLTSAMLTARKVFSTILAISALSGEETTLTVSQIRAYSSAARRVHSAVMPPTILGVFRMPYRSLPGSTRSGEKARKTSLPMRAPPRSRMGARTSRVVPG